MDFMNGSRVRGTRLRATLLCIAGSLIYTSASADTVFTVNGVDVDSAVVDLYFQSRLGGAEAQPTPDQREALISELKNIFILATQADAARIANDPKIAAQIELQKRSVVAQAVAADFFEKTEISDEAIKKEYEEQLAEFPPLDFKAKHILLATQGEATEVIAELNNGGNFEAIAKEKSTGPTGPNGGELDWFSPGQMVPAFSDAVAELEDGQFTAEPVQTQFGWHVILREASRESSPPTLESAKDQIKQKLQNDRFQLHLEELAKTAEG